MYKKEIEDYVESHKQEMIDDICMLCRINSEKMPYKEGMPYGEGPFQALSEALSMMESYGFSITNYDNYVGTADMNEKEPQLDILAHLDVVPAGEGWKETQPFEPIVKGNKLIGRGTSDDKGPAIAALYAMRAVKELNIPLKKNVRLILGTDEECGGSDLPHYYSVEKEAPMTFSPDASYPVVNTEKGRMDGHFTAAFTPSDKLPKLVSLEAGVKENVVPGKALATVKGVDKDVLDQAAVDCENKTGIQFVFETEGDLVTITAIGAGAHASTPKEGNNALTGLLTFLTKLPLAECEQVTMIHSLLELIPHGDTSGKGLGVAMSDEISGDLTIAFSLLKINESSLDGTFDSRCPICVTKENFLEVAKKNLAEKGFTLHNDSITPPHHVDGESHFVKTLLSAYETYTGRKGECVAMGGGTYVHDLKNGVAFGASMPETDNRMHGADEFAFIDELVVSAKIFAQVIVDLCS
jgi:succinyl-diaminopimelate desuccinylase